MIEIENPEQRAATLARVGGIENHIYLSVAGERISGIPDPTRENTSPDGKASAVQFMRFPFTAAQKAKFRAPGTQVLCAIDHPNYGHLAVMPEPVRAALELRVPLRVDLAAGPNWLDVSSLDDKVTR